MKSIHKILILTAAILICIISIISINNNNIVRTVRSERELREFYNNRYGRDLSTFERILTLPFSILIDGRVYNTRYKYIDDMPVVIEDAVESNEIGGSSTASKDYSKTNIQVEGVDEADIIKTDGDYIYSISENNVIISQANVPNIITIAIVKIIIELVLLVKFVFLIINLIAGSIIKEIIKATKNGI